ncbi:hypothetical protein [Sphingomonas sp. Leaf17]|uniref:hypothetical protein n=1 Tax=Sphingomonas sp. Leaf17 TaxID=1735683 RepID=UPI0012E2DF1C|nr:hypothetical protein [Sphingomonas sp. Leaf17]
MKQRKTGGKPATGAKTPSAAVRRVRFLAVLRETANVARAAREAGLGTSGLYKYRAGHAAFAEQWDAAVAEALDALEDALIHRAKHGTERAVFYRGGVVGSVKTYSDTLGMFVLRGRRPEIYGRAAVGSPSDASQMTDDEARAEVVRRLDRLAEPDAGDAE